MKKIFRVIKDFLFFTLVGLFWGFIGGLMLMMAVYTARHNPFWCLGVTGFFILFHLSDFQDFFRKGNWMAISGRFIALFGIASAIVSIFVLALTGFEGLDIFDALAFFILMPASIIVITFWMLLKQYGGDTRLYKEFEKIIDGLHVLGVLWKY